MVHVKTKEWTEGMNGSTNVQMQNTTTTVLTTVMIKQGREMHTLGELMVMPLR